MFFGHPTAFFQPFIDTATGRIAGVEALGRLRQDDGSHTSVGPLFADPGTPTLDLLHLDRTLRDDALRRFASAPDDWFLSLNLSPRWISQLERGAELPSLAQLERSGIAPSRIVYEITEAAGDLPSLTDAGQTAHRAQAFAEQRQEYRGAEHQRLLRRAGDLVPIRPHQIADEADGVVQGKR